eukprot:TRINITY_DN4017_c0_g2_i5.p1 TRINITY_DN4017_c0_g2~~TRINITY_DN4017_c0_g2_i5.p1  ORF type:complete len:495 (-),score=39.61 TRINITY_DN4017_c0_g2_i5:168-1607(-)
MCIRDRYLANLKEHKVIINLPNRAIELDGLVITKAVTLLGSPGSSIILKHDSITIQKEGSLQVTETAVETYSSKFTFEIQPGARLSLIDCAITCKNNSSAETIGIHVCSGSESEIGQVEVIASCFTGFFAHILCGKGSSAAIENCSFNACANSSVLAINPLQLEVKGSGFKDCNESSIEVRYTSGENEKEEKKSSKVTIRGNTLAGSKANGVIVCADKVSIFEFLELAIESNTIISAKLDGIVLRNITFYKKAIIASNDINECGSNGISIVSSYPIKKQELTLGKNRVACCGKAGIYAFDSVCKIIEGDISHNTKSGILLTNMRMTPSDIYQAVVTRLLVTENKRNGIEITDSGDCRIFLEDNVITKNRKTGIIINRQPEIQSASKSKLQYTGKVWIKGGKVKHNMWNGIEVTHNTLFLDSVVVKANVGYAVKLYGSYRDVRYSSRTIEQETIAGHILSNDKLVGLYNSSNPCSRCAIM